MSSNPLDILEEQHQHGLRELERLDAALTHLETNTSLASVMADIRKAVTFLDTEVRAHNQFEEDHLFPVLEVAAPHSPLAVMLEEHRELWSALDAVQQCLKVLDDAPLDAQAHKLLLREGWHICDLLRAHIEKENTVLFPTARECLTPEQLERISWAIV